MSLEKFLGSLGRAFIGAGIIVFLFTGYQLWGTNIAEARSQDKLDKEATDLFGPAGDDPTVTTSPPATAPPKPGEPPPATTTQPPNTTPAPPPVPEGKFVASIRIPSIGLSKAVVEGTTVEALKKGPGHYTPTPLPGQPGNAAIAGHRTTYGAPFGDLGNMKVGDQIDVTTRQGTFVYKMTERRIVLPSDETALAPTKDNRLTLTTCHPKFSAAQRMIIVAMLAPGAKAAPAPTTTVKPAPTTTAPLKPGQTVAPTTQAPSTTTTILGDLDGANVSGTASPKGPAVMWAFVTTLVGLAIWLISELWRRWPTYVLGAPVFLISLFVFFEQFALLLPANA